MASPFPSAEHVKVTPLLDAAALRDLRFEGKGSEKVGLVPFRRTRDGLRFLCAAPNPQEEPEDILPLALARGTIQIEVERESAKGVGAIREIIDASPDRWDGKGRLLHRETSVQTALREGEEELGTDRTRISHLYDCGLLRFKHKGIHWFLTGLASDHALGEAQASRQVKWLSLEKAQALAQKGEFNEAYLPLLIRFSEMAQGLVSHRSILPRNEEELIAR